MAWFSKAKKTPEAARETHRGDHKTGEHAPDATGRGTAPPSGPHTFTANGVTYDLANGPLPEIAGLLKLQLFSRHSRGAFHLVDRSALVCDEIVEGLWATLVFDFGSHEETVTRANTKNWQASRAEIWQAAIDNLGAQTVSAQHLSHNVMAVMGNGAFISALVLQLDALVHKLFGYSPAPVCSVVSVPNWHCILIQRFNVEPTKAETRELAGLTQKLFECDDPLSKTLYRSQAGALSKLEL